MEARGKYLGCRMSPHGQRGNIATMIIDFPLEHTTSDDRLLYRPEMGVTAAC
jgi:hypothetical protein